MLICVCYLFNLALQVSQLQILFQMCVYEICNLLQLLLFVLQEVLQLLHLRGDSSFCLGQLDT